MQAAWVSSVSPTDNGVRLKVLFLDGAQGFEQLAADLLQFSEALLVINEEAVVFQRMFNIEMGAQHHVTQMNRIGQDGVFIQFFEGGGWVIVIHGLILGVECDDASRGGRDARG